MDAATAAIIAAGVSSTVTGLVALGVGWLNPHTTAKRARETELVKMRRDTFVNALQLVSSVLASDLEPDGLRRLSRNMRQLIPQLSLLGNDNLANQYGQLANLTSELATIQRDLEVSDKVITELVKGLTAFTEDVRAHIGVNDLER